MCNGAPFTVEKDFGQMGTGNPEQKSFIHLRQFLSGIKIMGIFIFFFLGQEVPTTDNHPCTEYCRCTESGAIVCDQKECPTLNCADPVTLAGECCPQCGCFHGENETFYAAG